MKSEKTIEFENRLFKYLQGMGKYCVFECQLSNYLSNRSKKAGIVDCLCITTDETVYCYELKVTKQDFHSKNGHNFYGNFNYYVMPKELFDNIKDEIPNDIGVLVEDGKTLKSVKRSKRKELQIPVQTIKSYMLRSLYREYQKFFKMRY